MCAEKKDSENHKTSFIIDSKKVNFKNYIKFIKNFCALLNVPLYVPLNKIEIIPKNVQDTKKEYSSSADAICNETY